LENTVTNDKNTPNKAAYAQRWTYILPDPHL